VPGSALSHNQHQRARSAPSPQLSFAFGTLLTSMLGNAPRRAAWVAAAGMIACRASTPRTPMTEGPSYFSASAPESRRATVRDDARATLGIGAIRVCLRQLGPTLRAPTPYADTLRPQGRVLVRLHRPGTGVVVAGSEGGHGPGECALVEARAGRYDARVESELGPYRVELRAGYIDTLVVTYRVRLTPPAVPTGVRAPGAERGVAAGVGATEAAAAPPHWLTFPRS
jgi:hypothetical protein